MKVTNTSRDQAVNFTKPDGSTVSIKAGETADLDLDVNDPQVVAQMNFGSLVEADKSSSSSTKTVPPTPRAS